MAFDNKNLQGHVWTPGPDWITIGVKLRFSTVDPGWEFDFFRISKDAAGEYHLALRMGGGGGNPGWLELHDANKSTVYLSDDYLLSADTWHLFALKFKKSNSSDYRLWLNESLIASGSGENFDFGGTDARVEIRTQVGDITPRPAARRCLVRCAGWYVITDDESTSTVVEFVGFETGGFEEVARHGASTIDTSPAPPSAKETYICTVIAGAGATPED